MFDAQQTGSIVACKSWTSTGFDGIVTELIGRAVNETVLMPPPHNQMLNPALWWSYRLAHRRAAEPPAQTISALSMSRCLRSVMRPYGAIDFLSFECDSLFQPP